MGLTLYVRARLRVTRGGLVVEPFGTQQSGHLTSTASVDALAILPKQSARLARGAVVQAILLRPPVDAG